jgi:hypothetical protein
MYRKIVGLLALCLAATTVVAQTCPNNNRPQTFTWSVNGQVGHSVGTHTLYATQTGYCDYTSQNQPYCASTSQSYGEYPSWSLDSGTVSNPLYYHAVNLQINGGTAGANGAEIATQSTAAGTANSCLKGLGCNVTIGFSASVNGVGAGVSFPPTDLSFNRQTLYRQCVRLSQTLNTIASQRPMYPRDCHPRAQLSARLH